MKPSIIVKLTSFFLFSFVYGAGLWLEFGGIYHSFSAHSTEDGIISIFFPPNAIYRSIEFFWHSSEGSDRTKESVEISKNSNSNLSSTEVKDIIAFQTSVLDFIEGRDKEVFEYLTTDPVSRPGRTFGEMIILKGCGLARLTSSDILSYIEINDYMLQQVSPLTCASSYSPSIFKIENVELLRQLNKGFAEIDGISRNAFAELWGKAIIAGFHEIPPIIQITENSHLANQKLAPIMNEIMHLEDVAKSVGESEKEHKYAPLICDLKSKLINQVSSLPPDLREGWIAVTSLEGLKILEQNRRPR